MAKADPDNRKPAGPVIDAELAQYRDLMKVPSTFDDGFSWKALGGALFIALLMVPGAIYMGLLAGQGIGGAAQWVTVILFIEIARRAQNQLRRAEVFVLFYMAGAAMGAPFSGLLWQQFFIGSEAAQSSGIAAMLPSWYAPPLDSLSYTARSFFTVDWLPVVGLFIFGNIFGQLNNVILGYGLFRLTSDVEKLPFPMAPVGAQGIMALAEDAGDKSTDSSTAWRWRVFSIGGAIGLAFGAVYLLIPTVTGALTGTPVQIFTIPFTDMTAKTQSFLPAVATGICWDLGVVMWGMVMPFYAAVGGFIGLVCTLIANPVLRNFDILKTWQPGDNTIQTMFNNNLDFYFSFGIGVSIAVALVGFWQVFRSLRERRSQARRDVESRGESTISGVPAGRGDIKARWILAVYFVVTLAYILVSGWLINWHKGVMCVLVFFGFFYSPIISYVTARLEGLAGQAVSIPMITEASMILSGYQGVKCWFLPLPVANYGSMTVFYRQCELTGTRFTSIWKTQLILFPIILVSSFVFMNFIWGLAEVPSAVYPFAQQMWELQANNQCIMYSATLGEYSRFQDAFKPVILFIGTGVGLLLFTGLQSVGAPMLLSYGLVRGLNNPMPHYLIPEILGAVIGRFYFQKRLGLKWRQYVPVVAAGFSCGMGLITVFGIGITFMSKAVVSLPF